MPTAADFDKAFSGPYSAGIRRVWELAEPDLAPEIEPFSFVSPGLLSYVTEALGLQDEARRHLPLADLRDRVVVRAIAR